MIAIGAQGALAADPAHQHPAASSDAPLAEQVATLRDKVAKLEAAAKQGHTGKRSMPQMNAAADAAMPMSSPGMGMKQMPANGAMGAMGDMDMEDGMMGMGGMDKMGTKGMKMMGMDGMKMMGGMGGGAAMTSALPGFPGASHLYHIGATGLFLDHPEHITLSADQQTALNKIKESALLEKATAERKIAEANQDLWQLTADDEPDAGKIDAKLTEIEKLGAEQRRTFIRKVGEAAKVLTDEQRKALVGLPMPEDSTATPEDSKPAIPGSGMPDM